MSAKLVFLRRTSKEIEVFGGEVFIDIDGKNIGILGTEDFTYEIPQGKHKIKMYKSHTYGTFIGNAETELMIQEGENLLIKYSPPMLVNQPGTLVVTDFESYSQSEQLALEQERKISHDDDIEKQRKNEQEQRSQNGIMILVVIIIISAIIYGIYYATMMSNIYSR